MKVTVVTVCWNSAKTIEACVRSIVAQKDVDIEHVVVDGASTDDTIARIEAIEGWRGTIVSEPDKGIYDAMNKGLNRATGDVVGFLNSDDAYADEMVLSKIVRMFENESADVVMGDVRIGANDGSLRPRYYSAAGDWSSWFRYGYAPPHPGFYARTDRLKAQGGFEVDYKIAADFDLIMRLFKQGDLRIAHLPEVIVDMANGGVSTAGIKSTLLLNREIVHVCRKNGVYSNQMMVWSKYLWKIWQYFPRMRRQA